MSSDQFKGVERSGSSQQNVKPVDQKSSGREDVPKILEVNENGAPVVPPEVAENLEKTKSKEHQAHPNDVLHEMEVQTGS